LIPLTQYKGFYGPYSFRRNPKLYEKGWKQGAYISCSELLSEVLRNDCWASNKDLHNDLTNQLSDSRNVLILLTQACDIASPCSIEPTLEFVIARRPRQNQSHIYSILMRVAADFLS
jgi:hypothetical protein